VSGLEIGKKYRDGAVENARDSKSGLEMPGTRFKRHIQNVIFKRTGFLYGKKRINDCIQKSTVIENPLTCLPVFTSSEPSNHVATNFSRKPTFGRIAIFFFFFFSPQ
jgi:hypothetical protein